MVVLDHETDGKEEEETHGSDLHDGEGEEVANATRVEADPRHGVYLEGGMLLMEVDVEV